MDCSKDRFIQAGRKFLQRRGFTILEELEGTRHVCVARDDEEEGQPLAFIFVKTESGFDLGVPSFLRDEFERLAIDWLGNHPECLLDKGVQSVQVHSLEMVVLPNEEQAMVRFHRNCINA